MNHRIFIKGKAFASDVGFLKVYRLGQGSLLGCLNVLGVLIFPRERICIRLHQRPVSSGVLEARRPDELEAHSFRLHGFGF